jgi:hypothetical protein
MWCCTICPHRDLCSLHAESFDDLFDSIDHVRDNNDIRRFDCESKLKDYCSFDSHEAMLDHLVECHNKCIVHVDERVRRRLALLFSVFDIPN